MTSICANCGSKSTEINAANALACSDCGSTRRTITLKIGNITPIRGTRHQARALALSLLVEAYQIRLQAGPDRNLLAKLTDEIERGELDDDWIENARAAALYLKD